MGSSIQGQMLRRSARREVAIYFHGGALWVADFIDGEGQIVDAATWIRFNCGSASAWQARRRMVRESALPVSRELSMRIERLHHPAEARSARDAAVLAGRKSAETVRDRLAHVLRRIFWRRSRYRSPSAST
jgi:hypothetical protein